MSGTIWSRRAFVGGALTASLVAIAPSAQGTTPVQASANLARSYRGTIHAFGLVQSMALPLGVNSARVDFDRNVARMIEIVRIHASRCDWLAFDDTPLTGHRVETSNAATAALREQDLHLLANAAKQHACFLSFGGLLNGQDSIIVISPHGAIHDWAMPTRLAPLFITNSVEPTRNAVPLIDLNECRIALMPDDAAHGVVQAVIESEADVVITMGSGPISHIETARASLPALVLTVQAATPSVPMGVPSNEWGLTCAMDPHGTTIGRCPNSSEHVLVVSGSQPRTA